MTRLALLVTLVVTSISSALTISCNSGTYSAGLPPSKFEECSGVCFMARGTTRYHYGCAPSSQAPICQASNGVCCSTEKCNTAAIAPILTCYSGTDVSSTPTTTTQCADNDLCFVLDKGTGTYDFGCADPVSISCTSAASTCCSISRCNNEAAAPNNEGPKLTCFVSATEELDGAATEQCSTTCEKRRTTIGGTTSVTRSCSPASCTGVHAVGVAGVGSTAQHCCSTDFCNRSGHFSPNLFISLLCVITAIAAFLL